MGNCTKVNVEMDFGSDFEIEDRPGTPEELVETAALASRNLLPTKSKTRYEQVYECFQQWKKDKKASSNSERVLLAYFTELSDKKNMSSTMWAKYSMLKSTLKIHDKVDISKYSSLSAMLKQASKSHVPKQARSFTETEIQRFLDTAPDVAWLDVKVTSLLYSFVHFRSNSF